MAPVKSAELKDQAATAALYVTKGKAGQSKKASDYPLDDQGKLSSAGAASSLKHAEPTDLPSYPVVGLRNTESSAGAAASLANLNKKTFEHWKPGDIPAANKAAVLAKDYKPAPLWHPELSAAGSKAALLAAKDGGDVKIWRPESTDAGHSAAGQAMRMKGLSPQLDYGYPNEGERRAMMAATGAMSEGRRRAGSTPIVPPSAYPDSANSAANALKAATSANRPGKAQQPASAAPTAFKLDAGRIHNAAVTNMSREMYTSHPPVAPETEEKKRQEGLRAAAVSMAKQMYDVQQKRIDDAAALRRSDSHYAATSVHNRPVSIASTDDGRQTPQYVNLQEAAQKLAAERLAKLHDEHAAYRTYYGTQNAPPLHKLSIRGRNRRRASSDGEAGSDEERSRQIRNEMSLFTDKLAQVDNKKRQKDRDSLLAAAQRNVRASMHGMDERVFNETGKVSPAMMEEWEAKAKAKAAAESKTRMVNHGKVSIGGGKFMDQSEVDAIAAAKVQPTLDEISSTAEKHRARDEEIRQQQLERERIAEEKEADQRERDAKTKEDWRHFKEEEKREARARKDEERAKRAEERRTREENRRSRDEEKRKSRAEKTVSVVPVALVAVEPPSNELAENEESEEEEEGVVLGPEPPEPEPIPHVASIGPTDSKPQPLPGDEERMVPTFIPITERDPINASQMNIGLEPVATEESDLAPVYTAAETGDAPVQNLSNAEMIANRVFASPVEGETALDTAVEEPTGETPELVEATANTAEAPVVAADTVLAPGREGKTTILPTPLTTTDDTPTTRKPDAPIKQRISPPVATTETTVSGPTPSKLAKEKDSGKVSSWLKTKFSRRASKPTKPESNSAVPENREKAFVGGASLAVPEAGQSSSDHGDSSMHEVAMAGKDNTASTTLTAPATSDHSVVSPASDDIQPATGGVLHESTSSPSISSLSSDEDTRGRSAVRLADQIGHPAPISSVAHTGAPKSELLEPALPRPSASSGDAGDEFEEARDTFDSEKLNPPGPIGGSGRASDSPARDSKFVEEL